MATKTKRKTPKKAKQADPNVSRIVSFSLYPADIEILDAVVKESKERGGRATRSQVLRWALQQVDMREFPDIY